MTGKTFENGNPGSQSNQPHQAKEFSKMEERTYQEPFCILGSRGKFSPLYTRYLPPLEWFTEPPRKEVINFYKNINDKTELYLREKLANIQRELQEHRSNREVHFSDKKGKSYLYE